MKSHRILAIVGYVLIAAGVVSIAWSFIPASGTTNGDLPAGAEYYGYVKISMWANAHLSGDYQVEGGGDVNFYVLDQAQLDQFVQAGIPTDAMFATSGPTGEFSLDLPTLGNYYMVYDHSGDTSAHVVDVTYNVTGIELPFLILGLVLLVAGIVLAILSLRMRKKALAAVAPPGYAQPSDVRMYQDANRKP